MHTLATHSVEVHGQGAHQGLAFTGFHFGHPAEVQRRATHDLHVVVPLTDDAGCGLAHHGEGFYQQVVEAFTTVEPTAELGGLGAKGIVAERLRGGFEAGDMGNQPLERLQFLALTSAEDSVEDTHATRMLPAPQREGRLTP